MNGRVLLLSLHTALVAGSASAHLFWINEFHYDDAGTDAGEFVEIAGPAGFGDLATVSLVLYNGDGTPYGTPHSLSSFTPGATAGGLTFYSQPLNGIQNGAPDR